MAKRMYDINDENIEITKLTKHDSESINCQTVDSDTLNKIRNFDLKKRKKLGTKKVIAICTSLLHGPCPYKVQVCVGAGQ